MSLGPRRRGWSQGNRRIRSVDRRERSAGITLLELLIVLGVVGILAVIALPNFIDYIERSRRSDAMIALQRVANEQEQFYFDNNRYAATFASINVTNLSPDGYYALTLSSVSTTLFVARALPVAGSSQEGTGRLEIRSTGQKGWDPEEDGTYQCNWEDAGRSGGGC